MKGIVYILKSRQDRFYVGSTTNLVRRLRQHEAGNTATTKRMGSCLLVFHQVFTSLAQARTIERKLKSWKRKDFLEKIISDGKITINNGDWRSW